VVQVQRTINKFDGDSDPPFPTLPHQPRPALILCFPHTGRPRCNTNKFGCSCLASAVETF
jgi:hypothetical protein